MTPKIETKHLFAVWSEGYHVQEGKCGAAYHGTHRAATFKEACAMAMSSSANKPYYNEKSNTYYGCRLFDNEAEARRAFG